MWKGTQIGVALTRKHICTDNQLESNYIPLRKGHVVQLNIYNIWPLTPSGVWRGPVISGNI